MPITLGNTEITFPNGSTQNSAPTGAVGTSQGYFKLPSGFVCMFGYQVTNNVSSINITFNYPTIFTQVYQVQIQQYNSLGTDGNGQDFMPAVRTGSLTTTGFTASIASVADSGIFWMVLGRG